MNIKRLIAVAGTTALMLGSAVPALANYEGGNGGGYGGGSDVAIVNNSAAAYSNTGGNNQGNSATVKKAKVSGDVEVSGNNTLDTGNATAKASSVVVANVHKGDCECLGRKHKDVALIRNSAEAGADTGYNNQGNSATVKKAKVNDGGEVKVSGNNTGTTGNAAAKAKAWTVVNVHKN